MKSEGTNLSNPKEEPNYEKVTFVLDISKPFYEHMETSNLSVRQIKFGMRLIHWVIVKILTRKLGNSSKADDNDLFLMWCLIYNTKICNNDCVRFIFDRMIYCKDNPKKPIFFSSFVMIILHHNGIECKKEDLTESPKIMDYGVM